MTPDSYPYQGKIRVTPSHCPPPAAQEISAVVGGCVGVRVFYRALRGFALVGVLFQSRRSAVEGGELRLLPVFCIQIQKHGDWDGGRRYGFQYERRSGREKQSSVSGGRSATDF
ncbi:unnamed protein product [Cuscuta europaea]|uniref:Uncharacterized protein n=1 Tax=Cuscuta europaea TaxID=41803 RepID=A0A9P0YJ38_CUSEU|nr:unnamed protein product [Cuscuta europaea]